MKVSLVIVTYNSERTIKDCLSSVFSSPIEIEVIVVDNNSRDKTLEVVKQFPKVNFIQNKENFGFGKANNLAARQANGEYIFLILLTIIMKSFRLLQIIVMDQKLLQ